MGSNKLQEQKDIFEQHIFDSYFNLRVGIAVLAILFPLVLLIGGYTMEGDFRGSMSAYYLEINGKSMRDWFVGILWAIGIFLFLYKGWERNEGGGLNENWALNFAGLFAIGVAMFPTQIETKSVSVHGTCAVMLFVFMAYVCIFRAPDTLDELDNETLRNHFKNTYRVLGGLMLAVPVAAYCFAVVFDRLQNYTFIVEAFGVWVFASYWLVKSSELSLSGMERKNVPDLPLTSLTTTEPPRVVEVDPGILNYPTGLKIEVGEQYAFTAEGKWLDWFIPCGPEGWGRWFPLKYFNRQRGEPFFLLCGNVGKNDDFAFCIGKKYIWTVPKEVKELEDRQLYLFANDWSIAYGNNKPLPSKRGGPLKVTITRLEDDK
jgi:hypothetical protein